MKRKKRNIVLPIRNYSNPQGMREGPSSQPNGMIFGNGGSIKAYNPSLAKSDKSFQDWYSKNTLEGQSNIPFSDSLDYDYYSFFKNKGAGDIQNHFPDTYKRPNHETFSNESIYSTPENPGGQWKNNKFISMKRNKYNFGGQLGSILSTVAPLAGLIPGVGMLAAPVASMIGNQLQKDNQQSMMAMGGQVPIIPINVEKGELLAKGGRIRKSYTNFVPHPKEGMDPRGNTEEEEGTIVIPKNRAEEYKNNDKRMRNAMEKSLVSQQDWRANRALNMLKKGGLIHKGVYAKGGRIKMEGGGLTPDPRLQDQYNWNMFDNTPHASNVQANIAPMKGNLDRQYSWNFSGDNPIAAPQVNNYTMDRSERTSSTPQYSPLQTTSQRRPTNSSPNIQSPLNDILTYAAPAYNIGQGLFGKNQQLDDSNYQVKGRMPYRDMSNRDAQRGITQAERSGAYDLANRGQGYLSGRIALASKIGDSRAKAYEDIHNINAEGRNRADQINLGIEGTNAESRFRTADWNAKSSQAKNNFLAAGMGDLSAIGQNGRNNEMQRQWYKDAFPNARPMRKRGGRVTRKIRY